MLTGFVSYGIRRKRALSLPGLGKLGYRKAQGKGEQVADIGLEEALIVGAVRTPLGKQGGALSPVRPDDLAALVLQALMERTGVLPEEIEDVYMGCANQAGEDNRNVARMALLLAGFPVEVAGATVNRLCGSGLEAVASAARAVMLGEAHVYVGGGVESMSRAPWAIPILWVRRPRTWPRSARGSPPRRSNQRA